MVEPEIAASMSTPIRVITVDRGSMPSFLCHDQECCAGYYHWALENSLRLVPNLKRLEVWTLVVHTSYGS